MEVKGPDLDGIGRQELVQLTFGKPRNGSSRNEAAMTMTNRIPRGRATQHSHLGMDRLFIATRHRGDQKPVVPSYGR